MLPGKTVTPLDLIQMAWRRRWLILVPPVIATFAALLYSSTVPDMYQSDMLIAIDPQRVPDTFVRSTVTLRTDLRMDAISVQVTSRTNLERMISEFDLYPDQRLLVPMENIVELMRDSIDVQLERPRPGPRGPEPPNAFHVRFTYPDPNTAAQVTQQLGSLFVEQNSRDRRGQAQSTSSFLDVQLVETRKRLEVQERRLEAFREQHGKELPTQMQSNMQAITTTQLQVQSLVESTARDRDRKLMLERLYRDAVNEPPVAQSVLPPAGNPGSTGSAAIATSVQDQLVSARATLAALELRYTPDHPDVIRAKRLVAELEPKAKAEADALSSVPAGGDTASPPTATADPAKREQLRQMRAEIESLDRQVAFKESEEQRLRTEIAEYQRRIEAVPGLESEWAALTRDYDTQQTAYKELLSKSGAAKLAVDLEQEEIAESFRIVDAARVPVQPLPSMRLQINAGGLLLGLVLGLGIAALLEFRDSSFRTEGDVLEVLALPVLASIPYVQSSVELQSAKRRLLWLSALGLVMALGMGYVTWSLKLWNSLI
jgi:polysaccharide chain length determinant protein (PEP-CTERM system associated)